MVLSEEKDIKLLRGNLRPKSDCVLVTKLGTRNPVIELRGRVFYLCVPQLLSDKAILSE